MIINDLEEIFSCLQCRQFNHSGSMNINYCILCVSLRHLLAIPLDKWHPSLPSRTKQNSHYNNSSQRTHTVPRQQEEMFSLGAWLYLVIFYTKGFYTFTWDIYSTLMISTSSFWRSPLVSFSIISCKSFSWSKQSKKVSTKWLLKPKSCKWTLNDVYHS